MSAADRLYDYVFVDEDESADDDTLVEPGEPMTLADLERTLYDANDLADALDRGDVKARRPYAKHQLVIMRMPGYDALAECLSGKYGEPRITLPGIRALVQDLVRRLGRPASVVEQMDVREALACLTSPGGQADTGKLLNKQEVAEALWCSKRQFEAARKAHPGKFPEPDERDGKALLWRFWKIDADRERLAALCNGREWRRRQKAAKSSR